MSYMSKVSQFCVEKSQHLHISTFSYFYLICTIFTIHEIMPNLTVTLGLNSISGYHTVK